MDWKNYFDEAEKPLDRLVDDGGFTSILRTVACVGDSLSSGEFQIIKDDGKWGFYDMYEYSWGQFMARAGGMKVYNFSRGGMSAKWYMESFAEEKGFWDPELKCQAYFVALGVNDIFNSHQPVGSVEDIKENWQDNADTYAGHYGAILQRYREISPGAKFFLIIPPRDEKEAWNVDGAKISALLYQLAERFDNTYVIDLYRYAPVFDKEFREKFFLNGHMNPMGYALMGKMVASYADYIIRHNQKDFDLVGFLPH